VGVADGSLMVVSVTVCRDGIVVRRQEASGVRQWG